MMDDQTRETDRRAKWQRALLPLMTGTIVLAMFAFLCFSLLDTWSVRSGIANAPALDVREDLGRVDCAKATYSPHERGECLRWKVAVLLEAHTVNRRYHQANVALLVRVSVKYLGFLTGMLMSLVGAVFVLGQLTDGGSKLAMEGGGAKGALNTSSPGLILAVLGTTLMIVTIFVNPPTEVSDGNVYLNAPAETVGPVDGG